VVSVVEAIMAIVMARGSDNEGHCINVIQISYLDQVSLGQHYKDHLGYVSAM
jgi:hypothetical protein